MSWLFSASVQTVRTGKSESGVGDFRASVWRRKRSSA